MLSGNGSFYISYINWFLPENKIDREKRYLLHKRVGSFLFLKSYIDQHLPDDHGSYDPKIHHDLTNADDNVIRVFVTVWQLFIRRSCPIVESIRYAGTRRIFIQKVIQEIPNHQHYHDDCFQFLLQVGPLPDFNFLVHEKPILQIHLLQIYLLHFSR